MNKKYFRLAIIVISIANGNLALAEGFTFKVTPMSDSECVKDVKATVCEHPALKSKMSSCDPSILDPYKAIGLIRVETNLNATASFKDDFRKAIEHTTRSVLKD